MSALSHSVSLCQVVSRVVRVCWAVLRRLADALHRQITIPHEKSVKMRKTCHRRAEASRHARASHGPRPACATGSTGGSALLPIEGPMQIRRPTDECHATSSRRFALLSEACAANLDKGHGYVLNALAARGRHQTHVCQRLGARACMTYSHA